MRDEPTTESLIEAYGRTYLAAEPDLSAERLCDLVADGAQCHPRYAATWLFILGLLPKRPKPEP